MGIELFEKAQPILETIEDNEFKAYFVGGSVRDYLMDRAIHDIDITTSATPDEVEEMFDKTIPIGKEHGTINVVYNNENYEVTTFRAEAEYLDHRRPSEVYFVRDLKEDLQRRDFTINAIAMDRYYKVYDYFDGQRDINQQRIRTVGNAQERFSEDALRIIRGLRFQAQLGFSLDEATYSAMQDQIADIEHLSIERIIVEFKKLIKGKNVSQSYRNSLNLSLFDYVPFFKEIDMSETTITMPISFEIWLAILMAKSQSELSLAILKLSNKEKSMIQLYKKIILELPNVNSKDAFRIFVYDYGEQNILEIFSIQSLLTLNNLAISSPLIVNAKSINEVAQQLPIHERKEMNINGGDLLNYFHKKSGPWLKEVLREIECAIITNKVQNVKKEILEWVKDNVKI
ncbi:CCA tRNA nucleotidyltransferase [Staphylococcus devriesei]|uniref:CCA-adding enzyme n=1 Tax=Staphylococcus devriesei TaxID=586733 RepID=A0A2K4DSJ2_9STAP|nr:CCA tRNA nucleotidyltransferase [Staphylococcus devriesei]MCE5089705.1 CCA tRNA nucleotidyltransferase [Staphylococcus devriesei]MCE5097388.1 CCA tRNA nucleotidyltransferase [Staphylococcus devriesei]PNZ89752.1 CCA tRNA nucleotidyltransferase [Staphylococcus devriesei]PTE72713.1 CCA tRNA nucleotidyltransferase [Staphylococcus devriesei]PTF04632.1 CCA tRNA nucleotidyltransferase [Staphylococcus devriesei]